MLAHTIIYATMRYNHTNVEVIIFKLAVKTFRLPFYAFSSICFYCEKFFDCSFTERVFFIGILTRNLVRLVADNGISAVEINAVC